LKILVLIHEYPPIGGGGGRVAQDLCTGFAKNGHDVVVLTADIDNLQSEQLEDFPVKRIWSARKEAFRASFVAMLGYVVVGFWEAHKIVRNWQPDLIHVHFAVPAGPIAWLLAKIFKIPYVLTAHLGDVPDASPEKTEQWFRWIFPFTPPIWKDAAEVVAVSEFTRQLALRHYPVDITVIPNGVDTQQFAPPEIVTNEMPRIIFAGRFVEQKNPLTLITVLSGLIDLPWQCVMFGDGPLRTEVETAITKYKLNDRIVLRGWVDPAEVVQAFGRSEILFMPSKSEGLPVVGVQAMASGMAIVAGNVGGFQDIVMPGSNGYLYHPEDITSMQTGLRTYLEAPDILLNARLNSLKLVKKFDLVTIVASYERIFHEVLTKRE